MADCDARPDLVNPVLTVEQAVEQLYRAFSAVPKPRRIDGCPCCIDRKNIGTLLATPLRSLAPDDLSAYASSVFLTVGGMPGYLYFLPRILEVTATDPAWWVHPAVTARAIRSAGLDTWPGERRSALNDYLMAVVDSDVRTDEYIRIDGWICAVGMMGFDVRPFLELVAGNTEAVLVFFDLNAECLPRRRLRSGFWELPCPAHDAVVEWFYSPEIARIPFEAYGYVLADGSS